MRNSFRRPMESRKVHGMEKSVESTTCTEVSEELPEETTKEQKNSADILRMTAQRKTIRLSIFKSLCNRVSVAAKNGYLLSFGEMTDIIMDDIANSIDENPDINTIMWAAILQRDSLTFSSERVQKLIKNT